MKRTYGWIAASVAIGALALAAQAQLGDEDAGQVNAPAATTAPTLVPSASASSSATATVGGFTYNWAPLIAAIEADNEVPDGYFIVGDATGSAPIFTYQKGNFLPSRVTRLASASKWFMSVMGMRMAQAGIVSLDSFMRPPLAYWTTNANDTKRNVQLKHALSMTSGFNANPLVGGCHLLPLSTLYACSKSIHDLRYDYTRPGNAPGAQYSYGPHGLQVAAAFVEAADTSLEPGAIPARQRNFHELFQQHVLGPFGMTATTWYNPALNQPANPWIAGGAYSTPDDYAKLLRGLLAGQLIADMEEFTRPRTAGLPREFVPGSADTWEYALGSFVECDTPSGCATSKINSSPGAYGWTGWIDRSTGYYGLIAVDIAVGGDRKGVELEQAMQPLIETAIATRAPAP